MPNDPVVKEPWSTGKRITFVLFLAAVVIDACVVVGNLQHLTDRATICSAIGMHAGVGAFLYIMYATFPR